MDLRRHQRVPVTFRSFLSSRRIGDDVGTALDLSPQGCKIRSDMRVVTRMNVVVHLDIPGQESMIEIKQAGVRWVWGGEFGLEFTDLHPSALERLVHFLKNVQNGQVSPSDPDLITLHFDGDPMTLNLPASMLVLCLVFLADHVQGLTGPDKPSEPTERADAMGDCADRKAVRPSPKERVAVIKLLEQKPRPKTYIDADIKYLRSLMEKAVWTGAERRIVWEMWQEVTGQSLDVETAAPH